MVAQQFTLQSCINIAGSMISWGLCLGRGCFLKIACREWMGMFGGWGWYRQWQYQLLLHTHWTLPPPLSYQGSQLPWQCCIWPNVWMGVEFQERVWASGEQTDTLTHCSLILTILSWNNCCTYVRVRRPKDKGKARERTEQRWWYLEIPSARGELMRSPIFLHGSATEVEALHGLPQCFCATGQPPN